MVSLCGHCGRMAMKPYLAPDKNTENFLPDFLKGLCDGCGRPITRKVIPAKESCSVCVQRFYVGNYHVKREHSFNYKVNIKVVGLHCLACDETFPANINFDSLPECIPKDLSLEKFITPIPFKSAKVIEGIHPAKFKPFTPIKERTVRVKQERKEIPVKPLNDYMPDFLQE